jgi:hypothetical protein
MFTDTEPRFAGLAKLLIAKVKKWAYREHLIPSEGYIRDKSVRGNLTSKLV